ncbi:hypothetical protein EDB87DRAFT_1756383 [Lactarius vividus]|nr:hypothetical protein EDB87DRAFT_1756383 [Lactarius vividus]
MDSPSETSAPVSALKHFTSPSLIPIPVTRNPSPVSLSRVPSSSSSSSTSSDSSSSLASSSQMVTPVPQFSSAILPVNFRASQFLSSCSNPPATHSQINLYPTPSSQASSSSTLAPSSSSLFTAPTTSQPPDAITTTVAPTPPAPPVLPILPALPAPPLILPVPPLAPPAPLVAMAANPPIGPAAMPSTHERKAPFFSGCVGDPLDEFLQEYEELATTFVLTPQQKVETILRYIPHDLRDLWKILDGYTAHDWALFRQSLEQIYEGTSAQSRHSKQKLYDFTHYSSRTRMHDEEDIIHYYRQFLVFCQPLVEDHRITTDEHDYAFWYGFHPDDREKLSPRLLAKFPDQPIGQPYNFNEVFKIARAAFSSSPFFPIQLQERWDQLNNYERTLGRGYGLSDRDPRGLGHEERERNRKPLFNFNSRDAHARPEYSRSDLVRPDWDFGRVLPTQPHVRMPDPVYSRVPEPPYAHACASEPYTRVPNLPATYAPKPPYARVPNPSYIHALDLHHAHTHTPLDVPHTRTHVPTPTIETKTVRFKEPTREEEDRELDELMDKMHGLSM